MDDWLKTMDMEREISVEKIGYTREALGGRTDEKSMSDRQHGVSEWLTEREGWRVIVLVF